MPQPDPIFYTIYEGDSVVKTGVADSIGEASEVFDDKIMVENADGGFGFVPNAEGMGEYMSRADGAVVLTKGDWKLVTSA